MLPFGLFRVAGESMSPTYHDGDLLLGRRWLIRPMVGDVIVIQVENRPLIKRIKYLTGDQVEVAGDNPEVSTDSRAFGPIPTSHIAAKIIARLG